MISASVKFQLNIYSGWYVIKMYLWRTHQDGRQMNATTSYFVFIFLLVVCAAKIAWRGVKAALSCLWFLRPMSWVYISNPHPTRTSVVWDKLPLGLGHLSPTPTGVKNINESQRRSIQTTHLPRRVSYLEKATQVRCVRCDTLFTLHLKSQTCEQQQQSLFSQDKKTTASANCRRVVV